MTLQEQIIDRSERQSSGGRPLRDEDDFYNDAVRGGATRRLKREALGDAFGLLALVPLVKVAWAEGRITRRERALIMQAARRQGVEENSTADAVLSKWLDARPPEEFFERAFVHLRSLLHALPEDGGNDVVLDLLSLCTSVAEVSGGSPSVRAGGRMICDEEVASVKSIAANLARTDWQDFSELFEMSETTGVTDVSILRRLREAGFTTRTGALLPLVPLVETAWAEGRVSLQERRIVLCAARLQGIACASPAHEMLERLLEERPSRDFFSTCFVALKSVIHVLPPGLREIEQIDLLDSCERVARASSDGGTASFHETERKICDEERQLLNRLALELGQARAA